MDITDIIIGQRVSLYSDDPYYGTLTPEDNVAMEVTSIDGDEVTLTSVEFGEVIERNAEDIEHALGTHPTYLGDLA